jgi:DNA-binding transcriptional ArsR family regulator
LFDRHRTLLFDEGQTVRGVVVTPPAHPASEPPQPADLVTVLQALSDPVRLEIVRQLAGCSENAAITCGQLELEVSKSTASHHLKALRSAGIVAEREEGTRKFTWLRKADMEERYPGLLASVLSAAAREETAAG